MGVGCPESQGDLRGAPCLDSWMTYSWPTSGYLCAHLEGAAQGGQLPLQLETVGDEGRPALVQRRQLLGHLRRGRADRISGSSYDAALRSKKHCYHHDHFALTASICICVHCCTGLYRAEAKAGSQRASDGAYNPQSRWPTSAVAASDASMCAVKRRFCSDSSRIWPHRLRQNSRGTIGCRLASARADVRHTAARSGMACISWIQAALQT